MSTRELTGIVTPIGTSRVRSVERFRRRARISLGRAVLIMAAGLYVTLVLLVPLAALMWEAIQAGIPAIAQELATDGALQGLRRSALLVAIAVAVNGTFGMFGGIVLARHRFIGRKVLDSLVDLTLALSPVVIGLAFLLVVGRGGWLYPLLEAADVSIAFSFPGLVIATLFVTLPFTVREVVIVLEDLGTEEEEVAATLGASAWQTFWHITLPNVRRGLTLGLTLTAARALGEFGAVLVLGGAIAGRTDTATTFIYAMSEERRDAAVFGMALILSLSSLLLLILIEYTKSRRMRR
jgi:sulfate transport system permease protein